MHIFLLQILTSVSLELTVVVRMQSVLMQWEATSAPA